jgi:pSer/pThr/pTyr-binding forkhead associated (FHA) protein
LEGSAFYVYDLAATNPTLVNDRPVSRYKLDEGDRIQLGDTILVFKRA